MEAIKVSDGCCTTLFCQCTNGQENYLYSCYDGDVFCNAFQQCLNKELCLDNAQQCCDVGLQTTEETIKTCDDLCEGLDDVNVGNSCQPNYCYCLSSEGYDVDCPEENTQWCPEQEKCIANCEENCYGGGGSTTSVTSDSSSTTSAGTSENPTTTLVPSPSTQEPSTTTQELSTTSEEPSTTSAELSTSEQTLDCDALCADMEAIKVSDGCCTTLFCQCTNGQENYLYSCYDGDVFCNAFQQCLNKELCLDNAQQCCDVGLQTTTTVTTSNIASTTSKEDSTTIGETTTESGIKSCDELCEGLDDAYVGNYCLPNYCYCLTSGGYDIDCTEENTLWCPDQNQCIDNCEEKC